jgi:beta-lactam-binding protein with PASTA domain
VAMRTGTAAATVPTTMLAGQTGATRQTTAYAAPPYADPDDRNRGVWWAVAGVLAVLILALGGWLLYRALSGDSKDPGSTVPASVTLPNLVGATLEDAQQQLTALNLAFTAVPVANPAVPEDVVYQTDPPAGALVPVGQAVTLTYNPIAASVAIENVSGLSLADATAKLQGQGFVVTSSSANDSTVAQGTVIRTEPAAGQQAKHGTTVNIVVSGGPGQVTVPAVAGQSQADATNALRAAPFGFNVTVQNQASASVAKGTAIGTNPQANASLAPGSAITLFISSGPQQVQVPAVEGSSEADARSALGNVGLQVTVRYVTVTFGSPDDGKVISQSPDATTSVDPGSTVRLTVGKAVQPTTTKATTTTSTIPATTATKPPATTTTVAATTTAATSTTVP